MKFVLIAVICFLSFPCYSQLDFMEIEGIYSGKNLYIQNPLSEANQKYCTQKIYINKIVLDSGFATSAYEIRFDTMSLKTGDTVLIRFEHFSDCRPNIIQEMVHPKSAFDVKNISIDSTGLLKWTTKNEEYKLTYQIQHYVWNKWIIVGEVLGKGNFNSNSYEFQVSLHSGENKVRVMQNFPSHRYSPVVTVNNKNEKPELFHYTVTDELEFSREVRYEIWDSYGNLLKTGVAQKVDVSDMKKGAYFLNFDNDESQFIKRK